MMVRAFNLAETAQMTNQDWKNSALPEYRAALVILSRL